MDSMSMWGTLVLGLAATVISVAAFVQSDRVARRESYVAARDILTDLTTGEIAHARDVIGILRHGTEVAWKELAYSDVINCYYVLEWALERTGFGFQGLRPAGHKVRGSMRKVVTWHIEELVTALTLLHDSFDRDMGDADTWKSLQTLVQEMRIKPSPPDPKELEEIRHRIATIKKRG